MCGVCVCAQLGRIWAGERDAALAEAPGLEFRDQARGGAHVEGGPAACSLATRPPSPLAACL
jgi:hypothetical protein